jgi:hypothetical protein
MRVCMYVCVCERENMCVCVCHDLNPANYTTHTHTHTQPIVAWCIGTCADMFPYEVQFGHAGACANAKAETAHAKNAALREQGVHVPENFEQFPRCVCVCVCVYVCSNICMCMCVCVCVCA